MTLHEKNKINIGIAGHTNTGKTTLIRTLMRTIIGEVEDSPNVTKRGKAYFYDGLQADFTDTPGFQHSSVVSMYLDGKEGDPNYTLPKKWQEKLIYDLDAMRSLEDTDIALYVASLSTVPDDSYKEEISVVKRIQPKVVGILNHYKRELEARDGSYKQLEHRIEQWIEIFREQEINHVIIFDAHWDNPAKINKIYNSVKQVLESEESSLFSEGLEMFKARQAEIRNQVSKIFAEYIGRIQKYEGKSIKKSEYDNTSKREETKQNIARDLESISADFIARVYLIYQIAAKYSTATKDEIKLKIQHSNNIGARLGLGGSVAAILGGGAAAIGAGIGALVTGLLTGGLGAGAGALVGAQIGGVIGTAVGSMAVFSDDDDIIKMSLQSEDLEKIVTTALATIWALSNSGYGRGKSVSEDEIRQIETSIKILQSQKRVSNWQTLANQLLIEYCGHILTLLEEKEEIN